MAAATTPGRRIPILEGGKLPALEQPGDYCGPVEGYTGDKPAVMFLKPNAHDDDAHPFARVVNHVTSPPHEFIEEVDGSLTISPSISDTRRGSDESDGWHGYLESGVWRRVS